MRNGVATKCLQVSNQVNSVALHPNQTELIVADESGCINIWDLKSDKTEQLVSFCLINFIIFLLKNNL